MSHELHGQAVLVAPLASLVELVGSPESDWLREDTMVEPTNGQHDPKKTVDGKFVDLEIRDDCVILCGKTIERKKDWNVDVKTWRQQWEFIKQKLARRGPMQTANVRSDLGSFRKLIEWSNKH